MKSVEPTPGQLGDGGAATAGREAKASRRAADALLREHPDAMVFAQTTEGHIVPVPESLGLDGYTVLAEGGRTGVDLCVGEDRMIVVNAWVQLLKEGVAEAHARLRSDPGQWRTVRMLDLRNRHGVVLSIVWSDGDAAPAPDERVSQAPASTTPRFCARKQDREGNVFECDEAYLQMFGYQHEDEVLGQPSFERVHPDDQARLIESWIAMVATGRVQMTRVRMERRGGGWLWVDTTYHNYLEEPQSYVLAECIDVSAEMAAQEALQDREELLRRLLEEMPDGLLQLDQERNVVYRNARLGEILDASAGERRVASAPGASDAGETTLDEILAAVSLAERARFDAVITRALEVGQGEDVELETDGAPEQRRHILFKVRPLLRDGRVTTGAIVSVQDVTESVRARFELELRAASDPLTGSRNRSSIIEALSENLVATAGTGAIYIDLDDFKSINDTLGHAAGDELLLAVTGRIRAAMRAGDELGRLGGDEFLVVLHEIADLDTAMAAAERISAALRGIYLLSCGNIELSASIGVAFARDAGVSAQELIERADNAMYHSKRHRRGTPVPAGHQ